MDYLNEPVKKLVERWEDRREIQNIMGSYTFDLMIRREKDIFEKYWSRTAPDISLSFNDGCYIGPEAVSGYYKACHEKNIMRTKLIMEDFPRETEGKTEQQLYACGVQNIKPLCNQIIEIAEDGETAKGFWCILGKMDEYGSSGPLSYWTSGYAGADFIKENGKWRVWHLMYAEDIHVPCGESWCDPPRKREENPHYYGIAHFELPAYSVKKTIYEPFTPRRAAGQRIRLPEPYRVFSETFSYGIEE